MNNDVILTNIKQSTIIVQRNILYYKIAFNFFTTLFIIFFVLLIVAFLFQSENITFLNFLINNKYYFIITFLLVLVFGYGGREIYKRFRYNQIGRFSEGLAPVNVGALIGGKWGFIDKKYNLVIPLIYDYVEGFTAEGLARVTIGEFVSGQGRTGFIDKLGNVVVKFDYGQVENFREGLALVMRGDMLHDFIDIFNNEPAQKKYGFIDKTGKEVIPLQYTMAHSFCGGIAAVTKSIGNVTRSGQKGNWGFINRSGELIIPYKYDEVKISKGTYIVKLEGKSYTIDRNAKLKELPNQIQLPKEKELINNNEINDVKPQIPKPDSSSDSPNLSGI